VFLPLGEADGRCNVWLLLSMKSLDTISVADEFTMNSILHALMQAKIHHPWISTEWQEACYLRAKLQTRRKYELYQCMDIIIEHLMPIGQPPSSLPISKQLGSPPVKYELSKEELSWSILYVDAQLERAPIGPSGILKRLITSYMHTRLGDDPQAMSIPKIDFKLPKAVKYSWRLLVPSP